MTNGLIQHITERVYQYTLGQPYCTQSAIGLEKDFAAKGACACLLEMTLQRRETEMKNVELLSLKAFLLTIVYIILH